MEGITFAGNLLVDHIKEIDTLPDRSELSKILSITNSTGGICNSCMDFKILSPDVKVNIMGLVGNDADGDFIINAFEKKGINTQGIKRKGITSFTDVFAENSTKCRTFYQFGGACDDFDIDNIDVDKLDCKIFHIAYLLLLKRLDGFDSEYGTRMARLLSLIQKKGILTSIDVVSDNGDKFKKVVVPALKHVDYLTVNELEAGNTVGISLRDDSNNLIKDNIKPVLQKLLDMGVNKWAVVHAPEGAFGLTKDGEYAEVKVKKLPKGYIGGTVGAGDAFCAGALLGAYKNTTIKDALVYGTASAQISLKSNTATGSMESIEKALEEYNKF